MTCIELVIGRVSLGREQMRLSKRQEHRASDRQCTPKRRANETEQETVEHRASNKLQMARKRATDSIAVVIEEFLVKTGPIVPTV